MSKKQTGKFYEGRGDDYFVANVTEDGEVVEIVQRDSIANRFESINFFKESAPKMIALIQKAAGIKAEKVEYEYAAQYPSQNTGKMLIVGDYWTDREDREDFINHMVEFGTKRKYTLVKRRKVGEVEAA